MDKINESTILNSIDVALILLSAKLYYDNLIEGYASYDIYEVDFFKHTISDRNRKKRKQYGECRKNY